MTRIMILVNWLREFFYVLFLIDIFNLVLQYWVDWELSFIIYFDLFYIVLF
jgi:hypothetical protein